MMKQSHMKKQSKLINRIRLGTGLRTGLLRSIILILMSFFLSAPAWAVTYVKAPPLEKIISTSPGSVSETKHITVPIITWGGDIATILSNGSQRKTASGSLFQKKGLSFSLKRVDDFKKQVESYIKGESPYLRGTMGMINMAAPLLSKYPDIKPVVIYQLTWSNGGDCLVVKSGIKNARDLKGKTIAVQAYGPHVDYLATIIRDAGLSMSDINIKWTKDLTGTDNTPAEAFYESGIDAAFVIIPDGLLLTSNGTIGDGSEGSVKGARIMLSTKTANRIISDVYAVRSDYFNTHKKDVKKFVHALMLGEQSLKSLMKEKSSKKSDYLKLMQASAEILLDSKQAVADAEALYGDVEFAGFKGNVRFFGDTNWPRNMMRLNTEIQTAFKSMNVITTKASFSHAKWDFASMKQGLTGIKDVDIPRFKKSEVARVVAKKQAMGTLDEGELFKFEIHFKPNQKTFSKDLYAPEFKKVVELAATYGGAIITVEGHSDPHKYNKKKKGGASKLVLKQIKQAAKNLSVSRALAVRNSIREYASAKSVPLDDSQLTVVGHGISKPKYRKPKTKEQWLDNMRVVFRIIQVEAEDSVFEPL